jgi:hypothetical protein
MKKYTIHNLSNTNENLRIVPGNQGEIQVRSQQTQVLTLDDDQNLAYLKPGPDPVFINEGIIQIQRDDEYKFIEYQNPVEYIQYGAMTALPIVGFAIALRIVKMITKPTVEP